MAQQAKKTKGRKAPMYSSESMALRYVGGLLLMAVGGVLFMAAGLKMEGTVFEAVRSFAHGLAGALAVILPVFPVWGGALLMISAQRKTPLRAFLMTLLLYLFILASITLMSQTRSGMGTVSLMDYFHEDNRLHYTNPSDYDVFLARGYELGRDRMYGGGLLGMLLAWPLWRLMGAVPGCMIAILLALGDVLLLFRKELTQLIQQMRAKNDANRQRAEREQAELRAREMQWRMQNAQQNPYNMPVAPPPGYQPPMQPPQPMQPYGNTYPQPMGNPGVPVGFQPTGKEQYEQMSSDMLYRQQAEYTSSLREEQQKHAGGKLRIPQLFTRKQKEAEQSPVQPDQSRRQAHESSQQTGKQPPIANRDAYRRPEAQKPAGQSEQHTQTKQRSLADWQLGGMQGAGANDFRAYTAPVQPVHEPEAAEAQPETAPQQQATVQPPMQMESRPAAPVQTQVKQPIATVQESMEEPTAYMPRRSSKRAEQAAEKPVEIPMERPVERPAAEEKKAPLTPWQRALEEKRAQAASASTEAAPQPIHEDTQPLAADDTPPWEDAPAHEAPVAAAPTYTVPKVQKEAPSGMWQPELHLPPRKNPDEPAADEEEEVIPPYVYPPMSLLREPVPYEGQMHEEDALRSRILEETLLSFKVPTTVRHVTHGPTISRFELELAEGIHVNKITSLEDNLAMRMAVESVRIEAPIPGTSLVGVEIPNREVQMVTLREVLESPEMLKMKSPLAVALGRDIAGRPIVCDIAKLPHLLVAGKTGSGKSVCINTIINSILFRTSPDEVRLILVDPKMVELQCYNGLPHLLLPVVNKPQKAAAALEWAVAEMMERYQKFADNGVRNITEYNQFTAANGKKMPYILIIIDEMADLMMVCGKEVEASIMRLAQLARAAGIHLVLATQRPTVKIITGNIKTNISGRIAFKTSATVDSMTILDSKGAEHLLGNGDMIFRDDRASIRAQGSFVSTEEIHEIANFIRANNVTRYDPDVVDQLEGIKEDVPTLDMSSTTDSQSDDSDSPLLARAIQMTVEEGQISASLLQRRLKLGYARAARIVDEMEERGIVSAKDGAKARMCLISREEYEAMKETLL